jgi:uncharacterized membrane protein YhaH (DUF805 family)
MGRIFSFHGRAGRGQFWLATVIVIVFFLVYLIWNYFFQISQPGQPENGGPEVFPTKMPDLAIACSLIGVVAIAIVAFLAVSVRRLHDRNKSGWWVLIYFLLPHVLGAIGVALQLPTPITSALLGASFIIQILALVDLGILAGTTGDNRYGPDPRASS